MTEPRSPLTPAQQAELREAMASAQSFLGAARVAAFNGWTLGTFAALSILFGLRSPATLAVGLGLAVVARNEFVGRAKLRSLEAYGLALLWRNQIGLMALIVGYALWSMFRTVATPDPAVVQLMDLLGEGTGDLVQSLTLTAYGAVIAATVIFQGLNARYYFVRIERLRDYMLGTPRWILQLQRSLED